LIDTDQSVRFRDAPPIGHSADNQHSRFVACPLIAPKRAAQERMRLEIDVPGPSPGGRVRRKAASGGFEPESEPVSSGPRAVH
jgi:hypothetical protein